MFTPGDVSGSNTLTDSDHLYSAHINELRKAVTQKTVITVGTAAGADYVCTGTADDVQIQAAVAAAYAAGGGIVYIQPGTYNISSVISIGGGFPGAVVIEGAGWNTQLKLTALANCYMFDFGLNGNPQFTSGLVLRNLYLNCNGANQTAGGGIYARGAVWCQFDHLFIQTPFDEGIRFYQDGTGSYGHHNSIVDCLFRDGRNTNGGKGLAIKFEQADENRCIGCTFQDNGGSQPSNGQVYDTSAGINAFIGCSWVGGKTGAVFVNSDSGPGRLMFDSCAFDSPNNADMLTLRGDRSSIVNCQFLGIGNGASSGQCVGVHLIGAANTRVIGNNFDASTAFATAVQEDGGATNNIIEENTVTGTWLNGAPYVYSGVNTSKHFYTVGYFNADYIIPSGSTTANVQINQAMVDINAAGGGTVLVQPGLFTISNRLVVPSNVTLQGSGIDITTIKAVASYNPTAGPSGGRAMLVANNNSVSNVTITGITFNANVQNRAGLSSDGTQVTIDFKGGTQVYFTHNKLTNGLNWNVFFWQCTQLWIEDNICLGGYDSTYNQNDGIHVRSSQYFFIRSNYIDTNIGGGTSGDDAIAVGSSIAHSDRDCAYGVISNNIVTGHSRGILLLTEGDYNTRDIVVSNNSVRSTYSSGICLDKYTSNTQFGKLINITVSDNDIYDTGTSLSDSDGIRIGYQGAASKTIAFKNLTITGNTIRKTNVTADFGAGAGVAINTKGLGLVISNNNMFDIVSCRGIAIGGDSIPVKDAVISGNRIDMSTGVSGNPVGIAIYGLERAIVSNNQLFGNTSGTAIGINISGAATAGNDSEGTAKAETSRSINVNGNQLKNWDIGVNESAATGTDYNQYIGNITSTCTTSIQKNGANSVIVATTNLNVP